MTLLATGASAGDGVAVVQGTVNDPDLADSIRLEVEVRPTGTAFTDVATAASGPLPPGRRAVVRIGGLLDNTSYHWQARSVDQTDRASAWVAFGGNGTADPDFQIAVPESPASPAALGQFQTTGSAAIPVGGASEERTVVFKAAVSDPDPGDLLRLEVEVQPVGTEFANLPTNSSAETLSGNVAAITVTGLSDNVAYHWQARTVDQTGRAAAWAVFGGNAEAAPDFRVVMPATELLFTELPTSTVAAAILTPAVQVTAQNAFGSVATSFTGQVTVVIGSNPGGGTLSGTTTMTAVAGVATFSNLSIDKAGSGYTLVASTPGLVGATSASFNIVAAPASELVFATQPNQTPAGALLTPAVRVTARDAQGNTATDFTSTVTIAIGSNPGAGTLSGGTTVAAVAGVATFSSLSIDKVGTGYTLTATATGLPGATSTAFTITPGNATHVIFSVPASNTMAGAMITPAVRVTARDAHGNTATAFTGNVTVAIGTNSGGGTLSGTTMVAAAAGVATFLDLSVDKVGTGYTLTAAATGLGGATSTSFDVAEAPASQLVFDVHPSTTMATATITPAVAVSARDALGNVATGFAGDVTLAIGTNPSGGTLSGTTTVAAVAGVATFANLSINRSGTAYTLTAAATGLTGATSNAFTITPGAATQLRFTVQPTNTTAGATFTTAVQVTAEDDQGNTASGFTGVVTVAIGANPGAGTLSGATTRAAIAGVATFATLSIDKVGTGYTLTAAATGLPGAVSAAFTVTPGPASQLLFTVPPRNTPAGATITPAVEVTARDVLGNTATGFTGDVTVAIGTNPVAGTLSGTTTVAAVGGVATFSDLSINKVGTGYALTAAATGLGATSSTFAITPGTATTLVFTAQPSNIAAGATFTPAVQVTARDAQGNTATGFTGDVTVAIGTNPGAGTLSGTTTVAAVAGVATFSTLSIDNVGTGYTLTAAATGFSGATSTAFTIAPAAAIQLVFTVQATNTAAGATITPAVQVTARDAQGNTATAFTNAVTIAIGNNPGAGILSGSTSVAAVAGVATFSSLSIDKVGISYTLTATAAGLTGAASTAFTITPGNATELIFSVPPSSTLAGATITPAVRVTARDARGNTATAFTSNVTVAIGTNPGAGTLSGTTTVAATAGVATFFDLSIDKVGTGYTLTAAATGLSGVMSTGFDVATAPASQLVFSVQPSTALASATITPAVEVTARDALGNIATGFTGDVTLAIGTNPSGGTLSGTTTVAAVTGVAIFSNLNINRSGTGYTLTAAATGFTGATSTTFTINPGAATQLAFTGEPTNTTAGAPITPAVQVTARDAHGNTATGFTGSVTIAIGANPGAGTLSGPTTIAAVAGVASFSTLSIDRVGTGYTLTAAATGLAGTASAAFTVTPGSASQLLFSVPPSNTVAGAVITPAVEVTALDALGNTATGFTGGVTVVIATNPSGGTLSGTTSLAAVAGMTVFSDLSINKAASGYSLTASASGLAATSPTFAIMAGPVSSTQSTIVASPSSIMASSGSATVTVTARDANANPIGGATVVLAATGSGNTLIQPANQTDASGTATGTLSSTVAESKTLSASVSGIPVAQTATVTVTPPPVAAVEVTPGAASLPEGATIQLTATPKDASGNPLPGRVVTWASSDVAVTTVNGSGLVTGFAEGAATVTATSEGIGGTSAITITAPLPCLTRTGPTITLSGVITAAYSNTGLADNTRIDASTAQFLTSANTPVRVGGGSNTCFHGGEVIGALPPSTDWSTMHETFALLADGMPFFLLESARAFDYGDGASVARNATTPTKWTLRGVHFKYMRDDCIDNDFLNPGTIDDSFFDGCYVAFSSRPFTATQDGSSNVVIVKNSLFRLQDMDQGFSGPGHGGFFKWDPKAPRVALYNNVYRVDSPITVGNQTLAPPAGKLKDCANNVMIWLGSGPFPEALPSCYTLLTGAEGLQYWNSAVAAWKTGHPRALLDVGPPIISLYAPADGATLTGTVTLGATAVDDQDVVGVQFKLNGQNVGPEVVSESPLTKFTLSWNSQSVPNGTYTLTAAARDALGNTRTSAGITVTITDVAAVRVSPVSAGVEVGATVQLTATPEDAAGNPLPGRAVTWASGNAAVATVDGSGLVSGVATGFAVITATSDGRSGSATVTVTAATAAVVLVGAGDISSCGNNNDEATAALLDAVPGTVFTAGDNAYPDGTAQDFANCYEPTWGRHKARTRPAPGNHDYHTTGAAGYFGYFGGAAGDPTKGYYSYDLGSWHIIALNSNIPMSVGSAQEQWLRADLAASQKTCTLAYWHHARFSSSSNHGNSTAPQPLWQALYDANAELVVVAHDHTYERFAPQTATGVADPVRGIREFVVGTGGMGLYNFGTPVANSEVRYSGHGVLKLTLRPTGYDWAFIPIAGQTFTDSGSGVCH